MNIKSVLRTYSLLRQLTDDEAALLETLRQLNESEREALVEALSPQPVRKLSTKKSASKKSSRASSLEQQIKGAARGGGITLCGAKLTSSGLNCNLPEGHALHAGMGYADSHPFSPAAPTASDSSSANGGAGGGTRNLEDETESAAVAVGGSNE